MGRIERRDRRKETKEAKARELTRVGGDKKEIKSEDMPVRVKWFSVGTGGRDEGEGRVACERGMRA